MTDTIGAVGRLHDLAKLWQEGVLGIDGVWDEDYNLFVSGSGEIISHIHDKTQECVARGCVIHAPSDHHMRSWPTRWNYSIRIMERVCEHGLGHPDPDDHAYRLTIMDEDEADDFAEHECDQCCEEQALPDDKPVTLEFISGSDPGDENDYQERVNV